jgi:hypothetical protein
VSGDRLITKALFEAGSQCAKRLYLEAHEVGDAPEPSEHRKDLSEIGNQIVELASQAFRKGTTIDAEDMDRAVQQTADLLGGGKPVVMLGAAFRGGDAETRTDIALASASRELDIFEVKAGTTVKPRHIQDVALQIHVIESAGYRVKSASILHLNPKYLHKGSKTYPVQDLFKNLDVTKKARKLVAKVAEQIASFRTLLADESSCELPTGTWCRNPLPCPFLPRCLAEGPRFPLIHLPHLKRDQERQLHEQGIEDITQLDEQQPGLTLLQRRVLRSVKSDSLLVEPFVPIELTDVDFPLGFTHIQWHLEVLPRFEQSRPWQKTPYLWSMQVLHENGKVEKRGFVSKSAEDPRAPTLRSLATALRDIDTMLVHGGNLDERLRSMLDDLPELKPELRSLLQAPLLELGNLINHGVYHPGLAGSFELPVVHRALLGDKDAPSGTIADDEAAEVAYRRIMNSRTRAKTRDQLADDLQAYADRQSEMMLELFHFLRDARK